MTALAQALSAALLHFVWQGSLVAVLLWAALLLLRKRPAAWRYLASCAALALLAALPPATVWVLARGAAGKAPSGAIAGQATAAHFLAAAVPATAGPAVVSWLTRVESWALPVWSLGVLLLSIRLVWGAGQIYGLKRRGEPATGAVLETVERLAARMGVRQPVAVWISALADGPSVVGWIRPLILVPSATLLGLTPEQLEAVLAHEMAHIRRFDYPVNLLQMLIETLLFYHPAVWWVSARIRHERELCCDDLAVESCGNPLCYARALTRLERLRLVAPGMAMASTGGPLLYRIQRLMGVAGTEYRPSRLPAILGLCLGLGCLALNVHWAKAQEPAPQQKQQEPATVTITTKDGRSMTVTLRNGVKDEETAQPADFWMAAGEGRTATFTFDRRNGGILTAQAPSLGLRTNRIAAQYGRGIQIDTGNAAVLKHEPVEYPGSAIERNIQGTVTVEAILDANGEVSDAHVLAGPQELRKAALQSVLEWRFQPDATGVGSTRQVNIAFQIPAGGFPKEPQEPENEQRVLFRGPNIGVARKRMAEQSESTTQFLEDEIRALREKYQGQLQAGTSPELESQYEQEIRRLEEARLASDEAGLLASKIVPDNADAAVGRTVRSIDVRGISDPSRRELLSQLQLHIGDVLTADSASRFEAAVGKFQENLALAYALAEGNQVDIRIVNVGREDPVQVRVRK